MYPHLIEVHSKTGTPATLNIDHIVGFCADHTGSVITTSGVKVEQDFCSETYDEVKQLIFEAGCIITKADPRLDTTHPLTMEDLKDMTGEPVWNSNNGEWYLVNCVDIYQFDEGEEGQIAVCLASKAFSELLYNVDHLKMFPLYRMKGETK